MGLIETSPLAQTMFNDFEITGRTRTHVIQLAEPRFAAHPEVAQAFLAMRRAAAQDGFDLWPFSTFRDYETQLRIWNHKFVGKKPLYDMQGNVRDYARLSEAERIDCILNWSALPGGSRHQWGTEIDVVDRAVMPLGYVPKLLPEEVCEGGLFHPLHHWLDDNMARFGFFRPYQHYQGGMYPEPWHLSYAPVAMRAIEVLDVELLAQVTQTADILGKDLVIPRIPEIYVRHILNYVRPDEQRHAAWIPRSGPGLGSDAD